MFTTFFASLFLSINSFATDPCLDFEAQPPMYFEALTTALYSSEQQQGPFFEYLKANNIDPTGLYISPYPLKIADRFVKLLVVIDKAGVQSCAVLRVPMRKSCGHVGLEYHGRAQLSTDPIPADLLGDMERELCRVSAP